MNKVIFVLLALVFCAGCMMPFHRRAHANEHRRTHVIEHRRAH